MTQHGVWPRCEHGTQALTVERKSRMPNREHPPVQAVQVAIANGSMNRLA